MKDDVTAEVTPSGNVATSPGKSVVDRGRHLGMDAGATAARERGRSGNVATDADAAPAEEDQQAVPEPETEATADEQGDEDSPDADADADADAPGVLEGDADLANASLFGDADRVTVGDVERQVEALLLGCASDEERRDALGQLLDALTGMLATFDEGDLDDDAQDLDAE